MTARLLGATFRASPSFAMVPLERLPAAERETLVQVADVPDLAAVLVPVDRADGGVKLADGDTAGLLRLLREPGAIPERLRGAIEPDDLQRLVLDGILELEVEGRFASGAGAYAYLAPPPMPAPNGRLAQLAIAALEYGQAQPLGDVDRLAAKLYFYNRLPVTLDAKQRWPDRSAVCEWLGTVPSLERTYRRLSAASDQAGWIVWSLGGGSWPGSATGVHKLYVSPLPEDLPAAFAALVPELARQRPPVVKVGANAFGIARPDKLVVYFNGPAGLEAFAESALERLDGLRPHGVPFSAELGGGGLLSCGIDPPRPAAPAVSRRESWRTWVVGRLAQGLIEGRAASGTLEPWRFALSRLELDGVDTTNWRPSSAIWGGGPA